MELRRVLDYQKGYFYGSGGVGAVAVHYKAVQSDIKVHHYQNIGVRHPSPCLTSNLPV